MTSNNSNHHLNHVATIIADGPDAREPVGVALGGRGDWMDGSALATYEGFRRVGNRRLKIRRVVVV